jgi:hypothetical protein
MDFFNFRKHKIPSESIEAIFVKAAYDKSLRPMFYKTLLRSELYILTNKKEYLPNEKHDHSLDNIQVKSFKNGMVPIFTSAQRIFDMCGIVSLPINYVSMKALDIFEIFDPNATFILNPYSEVSKVLLPDEIRQLKCNEHFV